MAIGTFYHHSIKRKVTDLWQHESKNSDIAVVGNLYVYVTFSDLFSLTVGENCIWISEFISKLSYSNSDILTVKFAS